MDPSLSNIKERDKNIVFCYIRKTKPSSSAYNFVIPIEIIHIILFYFYENLIFYQKQHGHDLKFVNDTTVRKLRNTGWSTCLFGSFISRDECNGFDIHIRWNTLCNAHDHDGFFMGYIVNDIDEMIKDWNMCLGCISNKDSVGIWVGSTCRSFYYYHKEVNAKRLSYISAKKKV